jgi:hypothetical protein
MEKAPFWMKFKVEWQDCREYEGRTVINSFIRSIKYAMTTNIIWDTRTQ